MVGNVPVKVAVFGQDDRYTTTAPAAAGELRPNVIVGIFEVDTAHAQVVHRHVRYEKMVDKHLRFRPIKLEGQYYWLEQRLRPVARRIPIWEWGVRDPYKPQNYCTWMGMLRYRNDDALQTRFGNPPRQEEQGQHNTQ